MSETHLDLSRIPHLEERRKCLELCKQIEAIGNEKNEVVGKLQAELDEQRSKWRAEYEEKLRPLSEGVEQAAKPFDERINAIHEQMNDIGVEFDWGEGENYPMPELCSATGLPLIDDEVTFESNRNYDRIIGALVVTPKPEPEASNDGPEEREVA